MGHRIHLFGEAQVHNYDFLFPPFFFLRRLLPWSGLPSSTSCHLLPPLISQVGVLLLLQSKVFFFFICFYLSKNGCFFWVVLKIEAWIPNAVFEEPLFVFWGGGLCVSFAQRACLPQGVVSFLSYGCTCYSSVGKWMIYAWVEAFSRNDTLSGKICVFFK